LKSLQPVLIPLCWVLCGVLTPCFGEAAGTTVQASKERELQLLYDTAREFYKAGKYYGARALFLEIKAAAPDYRHSKSYLEAVERKLAARRDGASGGTSTVAKRLYSEGLNLYKQKKYADAARNFRNLMNTEPSQGAEEHLARAELALKSQPALPRPSPDTPKVTAPAAPSEADKVDHVARLLDEAHRLESAGKIQEAASVARVVLGMDPRNKAAKRQLARLQSASEKAEPEAKPKAPVTTVALLEERADELYRQGKLEEARELYLQVLSRRPTSRVAKAMVGVIDRRLKAGAKPDESKVDAAARDTLLSRARAAVSAGDYPYARSLLADLLKSSPEDEAARQLMKRLELEEAKVRGKERERESSLAETAKVEEEMKHLRELRELVADREFQKVVKKADMLLKVRPHWPEVETIQTLALHAIESDKERWLKLKGDLLDHQALRELEEASHPPEDPGRILRPKVVLHKTPFELGSIQERLAQRVSVNLVEADLSYVLDLLFRATGVNIVANPAMLQGQQITIHVEQMPLQELLSFISRNYDILFSATPSAVWVSTPDQPLLETHIRHLNKGLTDVGEQVESTTSDVEKLMERVPELMDWPDGSSYYLDRKKNILFLRSTPEALVKVNELIDELDRDPLQILIETRFIELVADKFKDFDLDVELTSDFGVLTKGGANKVQVDKDSGVRFTGLANPTGNLTDGLGMAISGVLTDPQFKVIIRALEETNKAKTLSAPRILALNNYTSEIDITRDLVYIEDYEVDRADISGSTVGGADPDDPDGGTLSSEPVIIPTFATGDETGFRLKVTPSVGADHRLITLVLEPEIDTLVEWVTFNLVIPDYEGDAPIQRPIVSRRTLTTKVTVSDGSVLALAGLMESRRSTRKSKIPVLGDLPLIGGLFRSQSDLDRKTNLLIFVKATILDGEGRRYFDSDREGVELGEGAALREEDEFDFATRPE